VSRASVFANAEKVKNAGSFYAADRPEYLNSLKTIVAGDGYLVYSNVDEVVSITGEQFVSTLLPVGLRLGWNLVGVTEDIAVADLPVDVLLVKDLDEYYSSANQSGTLTVFEKGKAYWVKK